MSCRDLIKESFQNIDETILDYVESLVKESEDDLKTADDVYGAIGGLLKDVDSNKADEDIVEICEELFLLMKGNKKAQGNGLANQRVLSAPVNLAQLADNAKDRMDSHNTVWLAKKDDSSTVDQKKLEKVEAKLKQKQEKRAQLENLPKVQSLPDMASISQQISKKDIKLEQSTSGKSFDIRVENFDVCFGEKVLLQNASLLMSFGRRYGMVGRNGLGKTTLLRAMSSGGLKIPSHISILHVEQEVVGDDTEALDSVLESDTKRTQLLAEEKSLSQQMAAGSSEASGRLSEIYQELIAIEADKAPARAAVILAGLGFTPHMQHMHTKEFSGGWRMRLALARALFAKPDLLLLDEPTNMLDMKAIIWLENYLQGWPTTLLVVSHDRMFLNAVATDILHLHSQRLEAYRGDYDTYEKTRLEKLKNQQKEYEAQQQYREHIQVFIDRFRFNANRASQVQSKLKLLEKLPELVPVEKETEVLFKLPECDQLNPPVLQLDDLSFSYPGGQQLFNKVCVGASSESRICIVGENGAGKTTLLKLLLGELTPVSGIRHAHRNLRIGYFSQHHVDQLDMNVNSVELLANKFPGQPAEYYRNRLGAFGVSGDLGLRPVACLSGGQKSRVAFTQMCMSNPNFLILDEPTNHLDMETIEALGKSLIKFAGGVLLVSHDERLIRKICTELWVCANKTVTRLDGGIEEYRAIIEKEINSS